MKTMKMTWLHMQFVLIFVTSDSHAEPGRTAAKHLLTLASSWMIPYQKFKFRGFK
jgi:hypothetical protein